MFVALAILAIVVSGTLISFFLSSSAGTLMILAGAILYVIFNKKK
jgi:hypothetical protein